MSELEKNNFEYLVKFLIESVKDKNQPEIDRYEKAINTRYRAVLTMKQTQERKVKNLKSAIRMKAMDFSRELMGLK